MCIQCNAQCTVPMYLAVGNLRVPSRRAATQLNVPPPRIRTRAAIFEARHIYRTPGRRSSPPLNWIARHHTLDQPWAGPGVLVNSPTPVVRLPAPQHAAAQERPGEAPRLDRGQVRTHRRRRAKGVRRTAAAASSDCRGRDGHGDGRAERTGRVGRQEGQGAREGHDQYRGNPPPPPSSCSSSRKVFRASSPGEAREDAMTS